MIPLTGPGGLFTRLGALFCAEAVVQVATGETMPDSVNDALGTFDAETIPFRAIIEQTATIAQQLPSTNSGILQNLQQVASQTIVAMVQDDAPQQLAVLSVALPELIRQMIAESETVTATTVGASVSVLSAVGNGSVICTTKRPDGLQNEDILAETITLTATSTASLNVAGEATVAQPLLAGWPGGSGASGSIGVVTPGGSALVSNGSFEDDDDTAGQPDDWTIEVGTPATTIYLSDVEVQTITIAGTPASGYYILIFTNAAGEQAFTENIAWDATSAAVQTALQNLPGLGDVEVVQSGTTPNFTHTITFNGVSAPAQLTVINRLNTGSVTPATLTPGYPAFAGGRVLFFVGNGSQQTTILQSVALSRVSQYAFCLMQRDTLGAVAGAITVDLWDGLNTLEDEQGVANSLTFNVAGTSTNAWIHRTAFWRTPNTMPPTVYLRIRASTPIAAAAIVALDGVSLLPAVELYTGGVWAAAFAGSVPFAIGDLLAILATSDRAGTFQEDFERNFNMRSLGLLLPSSPVGTISNQLACGVQPGSSSSGSSS